MTHTNLTPNPDRCEVCGCADYDRLRFVYRGPRVVMLCDGCLSAQEPIATTVTTNSANLRSCACGQILTSPLHTRCTDCWERDMLASLARAMGEQASEAATHPRHDERMVLPALGHVVCATCGHYTNAYLTKPTPDGDLYYCIKCAGALLEAQGRACGRHDQMPALTDWPDERDPHIALMASKRYARMHGDGWLMNEVSDLLRVRGVRQDWGGHDSFGDWALLAGTALEAQGAQYALLARWRDILAAREMDTGHDGHDQHAA